MSLSINAKARSTSMCKRSIDRSGQTYMKTNGAQLAAFANGQETPLLERAKAIRKNIAKVTARIDKGKLSLKKLDHNGLEAADLRRKMGRWEQVLAKSIFDLSNLSDTYQRNIERENKRFQTLKAQMDGEIVKLNSGKVVPHKRIIDEKLKEAFKALSQEEEV